MVATERKKAKLKLYKPHEMQRALHESKARFNVAAFGRQSGKSTYGNQKLLHKGWTNKNKIYWFISPTYKNAKVMWRRIRNTTPPGVFMEVSKGDLFFRLRTGSYIFFMSGMVLEDLRTETLDGVIIDEVRNQHPDLWPMVIRPMLGTTGGWADFISTPNGFDAFYDRYEFAEKCKNGEWASFTAPSTCNPLFTQQEFESARADMSPAQFDQEILAIFRDIAQGKAYLSFSDDNLTRTCPFWEDVKLDWSPYLPIILCCDFNLNPMAWTLAQTKGGVWWFFDEIWLEDSHTPEATEELIQRLKAIKKAGHRANPMVVIVGDATSKAGQRAAAGQSDYDILCNGLRDAEINYSNKTPESNPAIKDRVASFNARCKTADGTIRLYAHPDNVPNFITDCRRVKWKKGAQFKLDAGTKGMLTHSTDGVGYAISKLTPIKKIRNVGMKVIARHI